MDKVIRLALLEMAREAVTKAGWHEHTNDWDWRLTVYAVNGDTFGTDPDPESLVWSDQFALSRYPNGEPVGENFTACVDYEQIIHIGIMCTNDADDGEFWQYVPIDQIDKVVFTQEG